MFSPYILYTSIFLKSKFLCLWYSLQDVHVQKLGPVRGRYTLKSFPRLRKKEVNSFYKDSIGQQPASAIIVRGFSRELFPF